MEPKSDHSPLIVIVGETASGKSTLALMLAKQFSGEIVCADSWTVYKGFNVGTAKPTVEDRKTVPHYLVDIADPRQGFSAAAYKSFAQAALQDIWARGKLPILVGGTGLYIDSVLFDYEFLPPPSVEMRRFLNALSIPELIKKINEQGLDITNIDIRNKRRLIRLLETGGRRPKRSELRANTIIIGLRVPHEELLARVSARVDAMLEAGLVTEVRHLARLYGWEVEPMKGIGYREFREYVSGTQTLRQTRDRIISATMNLAKRQRTWFKRNKSIHWISKQAEAVDLVTTFLNK